LNKGILYGIGAYLAWGFFPIYWKFLNHIPSIQLIAHRIIWSFIILVIIILYRRKWNEFLKTINFKTIRIYAIASILIGINWLVYVWAVNSNFIVETSLGYFINPLVSMMLGIIFFRERLRTAQWIPVILAAIGVAYLTYLYGRLPYIALALAFSFGLYGLVKKISPLGSLYGLAIETGILFLPSLLFLFHAETAGNGGFLHTGIIPDMLMIGTGLITTIPLLMFSTAARSIPLWIVGLLQYIATTIQFIIGVFVYKEPFSNGQLIGFSIIWTALVIFLVENYIASRTSDKTGKNFTEMP
jgi:chloramphenicol-sensitive protein RarD